MLVPNQAPSFPQGSSDGKTYFMPQRLLPDGTSPGEHSQDQPVPWKGQRPEGQKTGGLGSQQASIPAGERQGMGGLLDPTTHAEKLHIPAPAPFPMQKGFF